MTQADFVVVANRLPVDRHPDGGWRTSPGGLVTALEPVMRRAEGAWVGWPGMADIDVEPFDTDGMHLVPVSLSSADVENYYEGMSNDTFWPLYHDVISAPRYRRVWWDAYERVNQRFADAAASVAAEGATVWVQDYQLQLVPRLLREARPDLTIGYFHHIPFPAYGLYSQLPWRRQVLEGLLGADVIGFQRVADAGNFARAVRRVLRYETKATGIRIPQRDGSKRLALAKAFPISIDAQSYAELAARPDVRARAREIREGLGNPAKVLLGVDRLDYTKGIRHRLKAFGELLEDGRLDTEGVTLVQVASPSRERVDAYAQLRDEIELTVGRINGTFDTTGHTAIRYLHHSYPREEMAAMYLASDVMLVTALRDGMNLVAKEYVAARADNRGVLVLSEFAGAADELGSALLVNPHDIDGLKDIIMRAVRMTPGEQGRRMRALRKRVFERDVDAWSRSFLEALRAMRERKNVTMIPVWPSPEAVAEVERIARTERLLVALDFDGTLAPLADDPMAARATPEAVAALARLSSLPDTLVAFVSGRSLPDLRVIAEHGDESPVALSGSHGVQLWLPNEGEREREVDPVDDELRLELTGRAEAAVADVEGAWIERKSVGFALHTRLAASGDAAAAQREIDALIADRAPHWRRRTGYDIVEFSSRQEGKDTGVRDLRERFGATGVLFAGDDTTDEDALSQLGAGDLGIRVGMADTMASIRADDITAIADLLGYLATARAARGDRPQQ